MVSFTVRTRNNADARRMGIGTVVVPGVTCVTHTGGKNVRINTESPEEVRKWLDSSFLVDSYRESAT